MTRTRARARLLCGHRLVTLGVVIVGAACEPPATAPDPSASEKVASEASPAEADPLVSYDLRRLRPREDEPLADMFERVRVQAIGEHKRVAVLFSADWCEPCRHLDLELGNTHPESMIGDVRILELKEDDWSVGARMDEYNALRRRWEPVLNTYPLLLLLDAEGQRVEEMKDAKLRLEQAGLEPTLPVWFSS
ncbi:hypothetical protein [Enhygromyxa salina]|uniref:Thioredoxin domain-containing protein n=1 Tax=Enhygromyxa salina TaxID=215803 RepID=A0A2S9Y8A9_9BACT|nr:hypothetical protein [Enhygromyxa salina]PRQ01337.1 hypothetical protein ENSA7_57000 [Enhygromyxa salina]